MQINTTKRSQCIMIKENATNTNEKIDEMLNGNDTLDDDDRNEVMPTTAEYQPGKILDIFYHFMNI